MTSTPRTIGTTIDIATIRTNPKRSSFAAFNLHATAIVYIKEGKEVAVANGIPIYPQGSVSLNYLEDGDTVREEWSMISDTATTPIRIFEGTKT